MNYTTQCRELALATRERIKHQFGLSLEQGPVELAFKWFSDQMLSVAKARAEGAPIQLLATFDFTEVCGVTAEELEANGTLDTTKPADKPIITEGKRPAIVKKGGRA